MPDRLVFLTGHLAKARLERLLAELGKADFAWDIVDVGVKVAALMTEDIIRRRVRLPEGATKVIMPGRFRGNLDSLAEHFGVPVVRGPDEIADLPAFLGRAGKPPDLSRHDMRIFAEIVDAPTLAIDALVARAAKLRDAGADVIDLGCLPETPFPLLSDAVRELKRGGFTVSVDSANLDELSAGAAAGADYLLSLNEHSLPLAFGTGAVPILIPSMPGDLDSLGRAIDAAKAAGISFIADPVLDPIHFGFAASLGRFIQARRRWPDIELLMGTGNLTELTDSDSSGVTAVLAGICSELSIRSVLVVHVSPHTLRTVEEHDIARRVLFAAREDASLPRGYHPGLLQVHDRKPFPASLADIATLAGDVRDKNFRIMIADDGIHIFNSNGHHAAQDAFSLFANLGVEADGPHAFYLGAELMKAEIAWRLGKRYVQDEPLNWGVGAAMPEDDRTRLKQAGHTLQAKKLMPYIRETILTTVNRAGEVHIAPLGIIQDGDRWVIAPFRPSTTLDNLAEVPFAVANYTDDVRIFAGCLTGRKKWPTVPIPGCPVPRIEAALAHSVLEVGSISDDGVRPRHLCRVVSEATHAPFTGFNRAKAAVLELAILVSRLHMLPRAKIEAEIAYLTIAIDKTAGPEEREAWGWLMERVSAHLSQARNTLRE